MGVLVGVKRSSSPAVATENRSAEAAPAAETPLAASASAGSASVAASPASAESPCAVRAACPLLINVLLADTVLNVFRDHNFDSCTLCVCNAGPKVCHCNKTNFNPAAYLSLNVFGIKEKFV